MAFNYNYTLSDPNSSTDPQDGTVVQALGAALAGWSQYINGVGTLQVSLSIANLGGIDAAGDEVLAEATPTAFRYTGLSSNGEAVVQNSAAYALTTGNHIASSDISIYLNSEILPDLVNTQSDNLVQVLEHELGHGFGINGFRSASGQLNGEESAFDVLSSLTANGQDYFTGPVASSVFGGSVPLTTAQGPGSNYYHVGIGNASDPPALSNDLMYWLSGPNRSISGLDVAILEDTGLAVSTAGQVLIDPNPTSSIAELAGTGTASVVDAEVGGVTQPNEIVTVTTDGLTLGIVQASGTGVWSINPVGLIDGTYVFTATIAGAGGNQIVARQTVVLDTTDPLVATYNQVLEETPDAATLAAGRGLLENGVALQTIRAYLASTGSAATSITAIYAGCLGRAISNGELQTAEGDLANGGSLAGLRSYVATSAEAASALAAIYQSVLDLSAPPANIALDQTLLQGGQTLAGIRTYLSGTGEAFTALNTVYQEVLGQPIPMEDINLDETLLGQGQTLAGIQAYLATSSQAAAAIGNAYQTVLGRMPSTSELVSAEQSVATGSSLQGVTAGLIESPELAMDIGTHTALGPVNAGEPAAAQANFSASIDEATLPKQVGELAGGSPPARSSSSPPIEVLNGAGIEITPQTIAASSPNLVAGLLNSDALIANHPGSVSLTLTGPSGLEIINGFNPASDLLQVQTGQGAGFSNPSLFAIGSDTFIQFGYGAETYLQGVSETALHASNFRFV